MNDMKVVGNCTEPLENKRMRTKTVGFLSLPKKVQAVPADLKGHRQAPAINVRPLVLDFAIRPPAKYSLKLDQGFFASRDMFTGT
jgi:hypothetical protein